MSALTGAGPNLACVADQSVPTQSRSDGTGSSLGSGTGRPGIDGMLSDGGDTRFDRLVAASGVNGSGGAGTPTLTDPAPPGTGAGGGGRTLTTEDVASWTDRIIPGGVSRSSSATELPGVPGIGDRGVALLTPVDVPGVGGRPG